MGIFIVPRRLRFMYRKALRRLTARLRAGVSLVI